MYKSIDISLPYIPNDHARCSREELEAAIEKRTRRNVEKHREANEKFLEQTKADRIARTGK